jgi:hypothetical protein
MEGAGSRKGDCAVRRKLLLVLLAAMMAVMTIVGALPAFAQQYYTGEQQYYDEPAAGYCYLSPYVIAPC